MMTVTVRQTSAPFPTRTGSGEIMNVWISVDGCGFRGLAFKRPGENWTLLPLGQDRTRPWVALRIVKNQDGTQNVQVDYEMPAEAFALAQEQVAKL